MILLTFISFFLTTVFLYTTAPLTRALIIATQRFTVALLIFYPSTTSWYSFILLIIFLRGIIIIFTYISSLAPNKIIKYRPPTIILITILSRLITISALILTAPLIIEKEINTSSELLTPLTSPSIFKLYAFPLASLIILLISYLLLTLIVVVKITKYTTGPLRSNL